MHGASSTHCAMWSKTDSQLTGITTIVSKPKWRAHSSGCQEHPSDFGSLSIKNFLRYGNIPIIATFESEIMLVYHGGFGGASLVHFPCRTSRRIFPGRTLFFPPKKPKIPGGGAPPSQVYLFSSYLTPPPPSVDGYGSIEDINP